jgi:hypothetical protein
MTLITGRIVRRALLLGLVGGLLLPASGDAQLAPHRVEVGKFTCREFLALGGQERDRVLIYFNGYLDGKSGTKVWADAVVGARIDRAVGYCKATPTLTLMEAFDRAWKP